MTMFFTKLLVKPDFNYLVPYIPSNIQLFMSQSSTMMRRLLGGTEGRMSLGFDSRNGTGFYGSR